MMRKGLLMAAVAASLTVLAGCTGGDEPAAGLLPPVLPAPACAAVAGPLDPAQAALVDALGGAPESPLTPLAQTLAAAAAQSLDTPEAVAAALSAFASSQDPQAFADELTLAGDSLRCAVDQIIAALLELQDAAPAGSPVPGLDEALDQASLLASLLGPEAPAGLDFSALAPVMDALSQALEQIGGPLGIVPVPDTGPIRAAADIQAIALRRSAALIEDVLQLDSAGVITQTQGLATDLIAALENAGSPDLPGIPALPKVSIDPVIAQINEAAALLADPAQAEALFSALQTVLSAQGQNPVAVLSPLVMEALNGAPGSSQVADVLRMLEGGGVSPGGLPVPELGDLLDGLLGLLPG